jgi:hypothetical protein
MIPGVTRAPAIVLFAFFGTVGCAQGETSAPADGPGAVGARLLESAPPGERAPEPGRRPLVFMAGGDVNLGRKVGRRILNERGFDPFAGIRERLSGAHVRLVSRFILPTRPRSGRSKKTPSGPLPLPIS